MKTRNVLLFCIIFLNTSFSQNVLLKEKIEKIIADKKMVAGISVNCLENNETLEINGDIHFAMQSVFKFHIALAVLHEIDEGKYTLDQDVYIKKDDLKADTWSPLQKKYPAGNLKIPLKEILQYTVSQSDNNGCDILLKMIGGTRVVEEYIHSLGINDISIRATENEMSKNWNVQFTNWTTPNASIQLLQKFYTKNILSASGFTFLLKTMTETTTGNNRIRAQLPKGTVVADKTGTSETSENGIMAAVNDIGIITLPNGNHLAICIFVTDSHEKQEVNEKIIADVSKAVWDYFADK